MKVQEICEALKAVGPNVAYSGAVVPDGRFVHQFHVTEIPTTTYGYHRSKRAIMALITDHETDEIEITDDALGECI